MILLEIRIDGNQEDPDGNPIPYTRTTRRAKYRKVTKTGRPTQYARYLEYRDHCWRSLSAEDKHHLVNEIWPLVASGRYQFYLDCEIQFRGSRYGDCDNIIKGILDTFFPCKSKRCPDGPGDALLRGRPERVRDGQDCGYIRCVLRGPFPREEWPKIPIHKF